MSEEGEMFKKEIFLDSISSKINQSISDVCENRDVRKERYIYPYNGNIYNSIIAIENEEKQIAQNLKSFESYIKTTESVNIIGTIRKNFKKILSSLIHIMEEIIDICTDRFEINISESDSIKKGISLIEKIESNVKKINRLTKEQKDKISPKLSFHSFLMYDSSNVMKLKEYFSRYIETPPAKIIKNEILEIAKSYDKTSPVYSYYHTISKIISDMITNIKELETEGVYTKEEPYQIENFNDINKSLIQRLELIYLNKKSYTNLNIFTSKSLKPNLAELKFESDTEKELGGYVNGGSFFYHKQNPLPIQGINSPHLNSHDYIRLLSLGSDVDLSSFREDIKNTHFSNNFILDLEKRPRYNFLEYFNTLNIDEIISLYFVDFLPKVSPVLNKILSNNNEIGKLLKPIIKRCISMCKTYLKELDKDINDKSGEDISKEEIFLKCNLLTDIIRASIRFITLYNYDMIEYKFTSILTYLTFLEELSSNILKLKTEI